MKRSLIFIFILTRFFEIASQNITFSHLNTDNGLSQISVNSLYQDERGFMWIGTREGLNCYDGNRVRTYKLQKNNINSLPSNNIYRISGNKKGEVYVLTTEGLSKYNIKQDKFTSLWETIDINAIYYHKKLYVSKGADIFTYNAEKQKLEKLYTLPYKQASISSLLVTENDDVYIGTTSKGLFLLKKSGILTNPIPQKAHISNIYNDSQGTIWVGTWEHGLFSLSNNKLTNFTNDPQNSNSIASNFVRTCCEDNQGNIWIGTFAGLDKYNRKTQEFNHYQPSNQPSGLSHSSIWSIIKDHQGTLWLGTFFGGVNYFNPEYQIYTQYKPSSIESKGLSSPIVGRMIEDNKNNLWICTEGGGLNVYNRKSKTFKWYKAETNSNSISHNNVKSIYFDEKNELMWIGTHLGGLNKLDLRSNRFTHYKHIDGDSTSLPSDIVRQIVPHFQKLIVATENGICLFDPSSGKSKQLFRNTEKGRSIKIVADLYKDHEGLLWIATEGEGLFSYNFENNKLVNYRHAPNKPNSLSNNNINSITQDHLGYLWISTSGRGIDLYRYKTNDFENFDSQNGLSSDCVYNVLEAHSGRLLVITNQGFSEFDREKSSFHNYSIENGFPLSSIMPNGIYQTKDGEIFLGGTDGMVSFYEEALRFSQKPYKIILSRLIVNGEEVAINDDKGILKQAFSETSSITLKSQHPVFSIEFATTNYISTNRDEIVYKLEGFSNEWISVRDQNIITYTNLDAGNYKLIIKNKSGNTQTTLEIEVLPPFYKTIYACLFYLIVIGSALYYFVKSYKDRIRLQASLRYEKMHLQDIEELNLSKLRFFTNISHEFRTPLTLIIGQLEMLLQTQGFIPSVYNKILRIYKNSIQMRDLISELLDFRKQEQGHMKIKVSELNFVDFLYENYLFFLEYANTKQIKFVFNKEIDNIKVYYDSKQMQKVVNNLLSNAFKFTEAGETISINIRKVNNEVVFDVIDSGKGISENDIDKIFNRFYQSENIGVDNQGTGIGLALAKGIVDLHHGKIEVESKIGEGTRFSVSLKLGKDHFIEEQIRHQEYGIAEQSITLTKSEDQILIKQEQVFPNIKGAKILIVEDNEHLREMLSDIFEQFYTVIVACDGLEGLEKLKKEQVNIVLSDVLMPNMTGVELCKTIKTSMDICHIPVVLLTANTAIEHNLEGLRIGADDYITKPFNVDLLISRCNNLVNSRILLQEKFSNQPQITPQMLATNALDKAVLDKAQEIIEKYMDDSEFNVNIFAQEMGMSRTNLFAKIKGITGQTPNDFISISRLKKAAFLLKNNPEMNITEISISTGFGSLRYFSKCFKDIYHISPLNYRNS